VKYNVFQWAEQLPKTAPSREGSWPHLIHGSLGHSQSSPNGVSRFVQFIRFCTAYECDQQTHTGRDHAILFCRNKRRPKNKKRCSSKLDIGPDHPCCRINIKFCMEVIFLGSSVVLIKVHQNRLSSFRDVGVEIGPFRLLLWELYINWFLPRDAMLARYMLWPCMWHCSGRWIRA